MVSLAGEFTGKRCSVSSSAEKFMVPNEGIRMPDERMPRTANRAVAAIAPHSSSKIRTSGIIMNHLRMV
jgi:hypothetical protein